MSALPIRSNALNVGGSIQGNRVILSSQQRSRKRTHERSHAAGHTNHPQLADLLLKLGVKKIPAALAQKPGKTLDHPRVGSQKVAEVNRHTYVLCWRLQHSHPKSI